MSNIHTQASAKRVKPALVAVALGRIGKEPALVVTEPALVGTAPVLVGATPGLVGTTPGLVEATPGLVGTAPVLVEATPGLVGATPGLVEATPGLVEATPGLVEATPGLVEATPGLVGTTPVLVGTTPVLVEATPGLVGATPVLVVTTPGLIMTQFDRTITLYKFSTSPYNVSHFETPCLKGSPICTLKLNKMRTAKNIVIKNRLIWTAIFVVLISTAFKADNDGLSFTKENFTYANKQLKNLLQETKANPLAFPRTIDNAGKLVATDMYDWTPGFFPGCLWYDYEFTKDPIIKKAATEWTEKLEPLKTFTEHHDLGFMMYCSYGNAYRITGNSKYKDVLVQSAKSLSTRFNAKVGCIKSWNVFKSWDGKSTYNYPVIIDNMINLELLFFASKVTGDPKFKNIAISHALNTMKNQVRPDFSCYHVVCYDSITGKVLSRETAQGYANNSTWSRGQAWGVYGFTMVYRETKDKRFLETARKMADFYLDNKNLPADKVPYWDFNAGEKGYTPGVSSHAKEVKTKPRDASAAAIVASALFELSTYLGADGEKYKVAAVKIVHSLASDNYKAKLGTNGDFILKHSVGSIAHGFEIDVPLVYADYYFLEALHRYNNLLNGKAVN